MSENKLKDSKRDQNVSARSRLIMKAWKFKTYFGNCQCVGWIMWNIYTFNPSNGGSDWMCVHCVAKKGEKERCV